MLIECSFGILKERFRCLKVPLTFRSIVMACKVTGVCVLLHNFLIDSQDSFTDELRQEVDDELKEKLSKLNKEKLANKSTTASAVAKRRDLLFRLTGWTAKR